jgi:hypothetical protein
MLCISCGMCNLSGKGFGIRKALRWLDENLWRFHVSFFIVRKRRTSGRKLRSVISSFPLRSGRHGDSAERASTLAAFRRSSCTRLPFWAWRSKTQRFTDGDAKKVRTSLVTLFISISKNICIPLNFFFISWSSLIRIYNNLQCFMGLLLNL